MAANRYTPICLVTFLLLSIGYSYSQVPIPSTYPPNGNIYPWGYQIKGTSWNTTPYLPFIYNRMPFRMMLPPGVSYNSTTNTFTNTTGEKFPVHLFLHGLGEIGTENGYNLRHGARNFMNAMNAGQYRGLLVWPQNFTEYWGPGQQEILVGLINNLINKGLADPFRVSVNGLSSGGHGVWTSTYFNPQVFASCVPMSSAVVSTIAFMPEFVHIPVWLSQGGRDTRPTPGTSQALVNEFREIGGNIRLSLYPDLGHGTWDRMFTEPDFFPFFMRANKTNPHVFFGQAEFCPGDPISVRLGVTQGFDDYQWRKNGIVINGQTDNEIVVNSVGVYDVRINRNGVWSYFSPIPVEVKVKTPTITPPIQVNGLATAVVPDPNGNSTVPLQLPEGYIAYSWKKVGSEAIIGTERTITVNGSGEYIATVTEEFGCSSNYSAPFKVVNASGAGSPPAAINLSGNAPSQTTIQLNWSQNPTPANNETAFEIYLSLAPGGPYILNHKTAPDVTSYLVGGLVEDTDYYFLIRAVNNNGASSSTSELRIKTQIDAEAPTSPLNLRIDYTMSNSVFLRWDAATDNVGVYRYDVYRDDVKVLVTEGTSAVLFNLTENQVYNFTVKARDLTGNQSAPSNQATTAAVPNGLDYSYFEGTWTTLPNFNVLVPGETGHGANVDIGVRNRTNNIGFLWEGKIVIPVAGNYTFETRSKDGSKLYIGAYNESNLVVNNDGIHSSQYREGTYNFPSAGTYSIFITYFNGASGNPQMSIHWKNTAHGIGSTRQTIPNTAFIGNFQMPGNPPVAPNALTATPVSYDRINLAWNDNSNNENGFQIFRSTSNDGVYYSVGVTAAGIKIFSDNSVLPNTQYFYRVQALGQYGESGFNSEIPRGFDYSYYEADFLSCPPIETAVAKTKGVLSPSLNLLLRQKTTFYAFKFEGKIIIPANGQYTFYVSADDGAMLYINNQLIIDKDVISPTERNATITLNQGVYPVKVLYRQRSSSASLIVSWAGPGFTKVAIPNSAFRGVDVNSTALPLPSVPAAPSALNALALSTSAIRLTFSDNSNDETSFVVYRSTGNNTGYTTVATLPPNSDNSVEYTDANLFTNVTYYYKVVAKNVGGESGFSPETFARTLNNPPSIDAIADRTMRWGTTTDINLFATDMDVETLSLSGQNLPSFASVVDYGDGTGLLSFSPSQAQIGTYTNIVVRVNDQNGGSDTESFTLIVDSNFLPEWASLPDQSVEEAESLTVQVSATDQDNEAIVLHAYSVPSFGSFTDNGNGTGTLVFNPQYGRHGNYFINLEAIDTKGATSYLTVRLVVEEVRVNYKVLVNFNSTAANNAPAPWNNTNLTPAVGSGLTNLTDESNGQTDIDLAFLTTWGPQSNGIGDFGTVTGNNSGIYPDNVLRSYYFTNDNNNKSIQFSGLNPILKYSFVFFGSRVDGAGRITTYSVGGQTVSLDATNNTQNTVRIENITPNASNELVVDVNKASTSQFGYLNAMEVIAYFDDGNSPTAPQAIAALNNDDGSVSVSWVDNSSSETHFNVYRATSSGGTYSLLKTVSANVTSWADDQGLQSLATYYYKISANNFRGGNESNIVNVTIPNKPPVIAPIGDREVAQMSSLEINVTATDPENDDITLMASGLPGFVTFSDNGNGTGELQASPQIGQTGIYTIELTAKDALNNVGEPVSFTISVTEIVTVKTLVNFNDTRFPVAAPWNSWNTTPTAGKVLTNLRDINNNTTGISLNLLDAWTGGNILGEVTGNNSGVFPDDVMRTFYYYNNVSARRIRVSGLQPSKTYNFTFFGSRDGAGDKTTVYTIGTSSASLNASDNTSQVAKINGQKSAANGELTISIQKGPASQFAYLNALIIESYDDDGRPLAPSNLLAKALSRTSIDLTWLDNSSNETGFEIYQSQSSGGPFTRITTTGPNVVKYVHTGLSPNSKYYYRIRAINALGTSGYTPVSSAVTLEYSVFINFDDGRNGIAPAPWNTTARVPLDGDVWSNFKNESGQSTGINLTIIQNFSGSNPFGVNTGNNSGIYPDLVMQSFYYNEVAVTATLKFSGLSPSNHYNLVYFVSRAGTGNRNTDFIVNGQTVTLNASGNSTNTIQHAGVAPDINGEIFFSMRAGAGSVYGYLNALVLQTYVDPHGAPSARLATGEGQEMNSSEEDLFASLNAYPNPFKDDKVYLQFQTSERQDLSISMVSTLGIEVFSKNDYIDFEKNSVELDLTNRNLNKGLYLIKVSSNKGNKVLKIMRE